jgi:hypothetical protein
MVITVQYLIQRTWTVFLWIFALTAGLTLVGVAILWWKCNQSDLPYLQWLIVALIGEVITLIFTLAKQGFKYLPKIKIKKNKYETIEFILKFISEATSVTIVSSRLSWVNDEVVQKMISLSKNGVKIIIILPRKNDLVSHLDGYVDFIFTNIEPESRFTLINENRSGAEKLAISKGGYPEHEITIFDNYSGPQIIGMAKDIINKSKNEGHEKQMD